MIINESYFVALYNVNKTFLIVIVKGQRISAGKHHSTQYYILNLIDTLCVIVLEWKRNSIMPILNCFCE